MFCFSVARMSPFSFTVSVQSYRMCVISTKSRVCVRACVRSCVYDCMSVFVSVCVCVRAPRAFYVNEGVRVRVCLLVCVCVVYECLRA